MNSGDGFISEDNEGFIYYQEITEPASSFNLYVQWDVSDPSSCETYTIQIDGNALLGAEKGEPNDDAYGPVTPLIVGQIQTGHWILPGGDTDWFSMVAEAGKIYRISTSSLHPPYFSESYSMDTYMYLYDGAVSEMLGNSDDCYDYESSILWTCPATGTYYILVMHYDSSVDDATEYSIGRYDILAQEIDAAGSLLNGGFETGDFENWQVQESGLYPTVQSEVVRSGEYAAHLGDGAEGMYPQDGNIDLEAHSVLHQMFYVQDEETYPVLDFYYWIDFTDGDESQIFDWLKVTLVYYSDGWNYAEEHYLWRGTEGWALGTLDLSSCTGCYVDVRFEACALDGYETNNYYLDDVAVEYLTEDALMQDEPNEDTATATPITLGTPVTSWIYPYVDADAYQVELEAGAFYEVRTKDLFPGEYSDGLLLTTNIVVAPEGGDPEWENSSYLRWTEEGVNESYLIFEAPVAGTYHIEVTADYPDWGEGCSGRYTLSISIVEAPIT